MSNYLDFLELCGKLKTTKRTGWVRSGVDLPESIAEHMHRVALFGFLIPKSQGIDNDRLIKMGLVHDLAEAVAGDITPHCGVSREEKEKLEREGLARMCSFLPKETGEEISRLWEEYEAGESEEAKICHEIDKLEMVLQAHEYEKNGSRKLQDFFASTVGKIKNPFLKEIDAEIRKRRNSFS